MDPAAAAAGSGTEEKKAREAGPDFSASSASASSLPLCPYGSACTRKNPLHIASFNHFSAAPIAADSSKPHCPYGAQCYRKNPLHRAEMYHAPPPKVAPLSSFPTPFEEADYGDQTSSMRPPITIREVDMINLMTSIMEKPDWMRKLRDPEIKAKWRKEMLEQRKPLNRGGLTRRTIDYLFEELEDVATKAEAEAKDSGVDASASSAAASAGSDSSSLPAILPSPIHGLFFSDGLISSDLRARLERGVSKLENVPGSEQDWHPGSDMQVLDLVHPSLYCFRIGRSRQTKEPFRVEEALNMFGQGEIKNPKPEEEEDEKASESSSSSAATPARRVRRQAEGDYSKSDRYAWLPADLEVSDDGKAARWASYINNLHPTDHHELYDTLAEIAAKFIPMWERVLTELRNPTPHRVDASRGWYENPEWWNKEIDEEDEQKHNDPENSRASASATMDTDESKNNEESKNNDDEEEGMDDDYGDDYGYFENRPLYYPDVQLPYAAPSIPPSKYISLAGRRLQVIVKLANIVLTPDKPKYAGGSWHVEGMVNENIVASGIYYYHSSNIKESRLAFRQVCTEPDYEQGDDRGVGAVYGLENEGALNQRLGSIRTSEHRAIAFPNTLQHQVQPFELEDVTKAGYRKILVFFLVDPSSTEVISTANVPPQQRHWLLQATSTPFYQTLLNSTPLIPPLIQLITDYLHRDLGTVSKEQAESDRVKLMEERKYFVSQNNEKLFEREFSLCEH